MKLQEKIQTLRKRMGLSQEQLAEEIGVSRQSVYKWESGSALPDLPKIRKLSSFFHVTVDELIDDEKDLDSDKIPVFQAQAEPAPDEKTDQPSESPKEDADEKTEQQTPPQEPKIIIGYCDRCRKPIGQNEPYEVKHHTHSSIQKIYCAKCNQEMEETRKRNARAEELRCHHSGFVWGIVAGVLALIAGAITLIVHPFPDSAWGIMIPSSIFFVLGVWTLVSEVIWDEGFVADMFLAGFRSFRMPGIIFTWDLDGIIALIAIKLTLSILSIILSIAWFFLVTAFSMLCAVFCYPFHLVKHIKQDRPNNSHPNPENNNQ